MTEIYQTNLDGQTSGNSTPQQVKKSSDTKESLFLKIDTNKDGKISDDELKAAGYSGKHLSALSEAIFFAERDVNKWFMFDKNYNGSTDNVENEMWEIHNTDDYHKIGDMTPKEFAQKFNLKFEKFDINDFQSWCKNWIESDNPMVGIKAIIKKFHGIDLTDKETQLLYDVSKYQANRWLFKEEALYERLNVSSYTRLVTRDQTESCCGGDISKPPIGEQPKLNKNGEIDVKVCFPIFSAMEDEDSLNSASETKNRLAWAAFKTVPEKEAAKMSPLHWCNYKRDWEIVRDMGASDFRNLLKPENNEIRQKFEQKLSMTIPQILDYIDIVESVTGKDFDDGDWSLDAKSFYEVVDKINGTYEDEKILQGKTRADVPLERFELLEYLGKNGLLISQFELKKSNYCQVKQWF